MRIFRGPDGRRQVVVRPYGVKRRINDRRQFSRACITDRAESVNVPDSPMLVSSALRFRRLCVTRHVRGICTTPRALTFKVNSPPQSHWQVWDGAAPPPSYVSEKIKTIEVKDTLPRYGVLGDRLM